MKRVKTRGCHLMNFTIYTAQAFWPHHVEMRKQRDMAEKPLGKSHIEGRE
jgi:hypothetical protein